MATPEEMIPSEISDSEETEVEGNIPELHVVKDTRGVEKTEGESLSGKIEEYNIQGPTQGGEERRAEQARSEKEVRQKADDEFVTKVEESDRKDARERGIFRKMLGLKPKE